MADDASVQNFEDFLKGKLLNYEKIPSDGKIIFKITGYVIPSGKYEGKIVNIGFPIPQDYPTTAPYGIHVKSDHGFTENIPKSDNPSTLGGDWRFWSRQINNWNPGRRNSQYYIDHVNRWLEIN
ncbi:MAG: E2/UBC family protein [Nitrosotalea sp.]